VQLQLASYIGLQAPHLDAAQWTSLSADVDVTPDDTRSGVYMLQDRVDEAKRQFQDYSGELKLLAHQVCRLFWRGVLPCR
jgi:hypothetical protein